MSDAILLAAIEAQQQVVDRLESQVHKEEIKQESELQTKLRLLTERATKLADQLSQTTPGVKDETKRERDITIEGTPPTPSSKSKKSKQKNTKRVLVINSDDDDSDSDDEEEWTGSLKINKPDKLNDKNWKSWKNSVINILNGQNFWKFVNPDSTARPSAVIAGQIMSFFECSMNNDQRTNLGKSNIPRQAWAELCLSKEENAAAHAYNLICDFNGLQMSDSDSLEDYCKRFKELCDEIDEAHSEINPDEWKRVTRTTKFLSSLAPRFEIFRRQMVQNVETKTFTYADLMTRAKTDQNMQNPHGSNIHTANFAGKNPQNPQNQRRNFFDKNGKCLHTNHKAEDCYFLHPEKNPRSRNKNEESSAHAATTNPAPPAAPTKPAKKILGWGCVVSVASSVTFNNPNNWLIDTAASINVTGNRSLLTNLRKVKPNSIRGYNGSVITATEAGDLHATISLQGIISKLKITNVLYHPLIKANLIAVNSLNESGIRLEIDGGMKLIRDNTSMGIVRLVDGVYPITLTTINQPATKSSIANSATTDKEQFSLWHQRCAHVNINTMNKLSTLTENFHLKFSDTSQTCEACIAGKSHIAPYKPSTRVITKPMELIHCDICGPMPVSTYGDNKYFITFVDHFSRHGTISLLKQKSEAFTVFKEYQARMERLTGNKIITLRTDGGGEFNSNEMNSYLKQQGIHHEHSAPYSQQQNGVAERLNRTIMEATRSMGIAASLDEGYWGFAVLAAAHVRNRLPNSVTDKTPFESLLNVKPSINHFRVFGCIAHAHIDKSQRLKTDKKTVRCLMLGYRDDHKAYLLQVISTGKLIIRRDVTFIENKFINDPENSDSGFTERTFTDDEIDADDFDDSDNEDAHTEGIEPIVTNNKQSNSSGKITENLFSSSGENDSDDSESELSDNTEDNDVLTDNDFESLSDDDNEAREYENGEYPIVEDEEIINESFDDTNNDEKMTEENIEESQHQTSPHQSVASTPPKSAIKSSGLYTNKNHDTVEVEMTPYEFVDSIIDTENLFIPNTQGKLTLNKVLVSSLIGKEEEKKIVKILNERIKNNQIMRKEKHNSNALISFQSAHVAAAIELATADPRNRKEAMASAIALQWKSAEEEEIKSILSNKTWTLVECPPNRHPPLGVRWVYKTKYDESGNFERCKARLVAKGYAQRSGVDYHETFAPVVRFSSVRAILALGAHYDLEIHQMDVKTAFLNGNLGDDHVYMAQPEGYEVPGKEHLVCKLQKSLYGLKQAGRAWYERIDTELKRMKFTPLKSEPCIYVNINDNIVTVISLYVDDLLILSNSIQSVNEIKQQLSQLFDMKDLGEARFILGIKIERDRKNKTLSISQSEYIRNVAKRLNLSQPRGHTTTPMNPGIKLMKMKIDDIDNKQQPVDVKQYQMVIGSVLYAMLGTRPDIAFATNKLAQFNTAPSKIHWETLKNLVRYLSATADRKLVYTGRKSNEKNQQPELYGYCDADWGNNPDDRRSVTGYVFLLANGAVSWQSKAQSSVATSSTEAEYVAACQASKEAMSWRTLLNELQLDISKPTVIRSDNQSAIAMSKNPEFHQRSKHIDIQYHYVRERVAEKSITLDFISTDKMIADSLTKPLNGPQHRKLINQMGLTL